MILATVIFYSVLYGIARIWIHLDGRPSPLLEDLGSGLAKAAVVGLAAAAVVVVASQVTHKYLKWAKALEEEFRLILGRRKGAEVLVLALFSGTAEELLFRGAMQPVLGLVWTSLIFGGIHFIPQRVYLPWTLFAIVVGFLLGSIYEVTGNIYAPIVAHVTINAVNLWQICGPGSPTTPPTFPEDLPASPEGIPPSPPLRTDGAEPVSSP